MQTKRDQVQAHLFVMGRLTSALLRADPDAPESPQGRTNRGIALGIAAAVVLSAGAFVIGLILPATKETWRSPNTLIINKDTGASYLYQNGRLRPVRNYASARLIGGDKLQVTTVGAKSLNGVPHGSPVGIVGAPDALPRADAMNSGAWLVCTDVLRAQGRDRSGPGTATTSLGVGASGAAGGDPLKESEALLVSGPDQANYLVWQGRRLRLDAESHAQDSLGYGSVKPRPVSAGFLNSLPAGPDLSAPQVAGRGGRGPELDGQQSRIGQVIEVVVPGAERQYYLLREEGLEQLTETGAALVLGDPATREVAYQGGSVEVRKVGADALAGRTAPPGTTAGRGDAKLPPKPPRPRLVEERSVPCVDMEPTRSGSRISVVLAPKKAALGLTAVPATVEAAPACVPMESLTMSAGGGALVRARDAQGAPIGDTTYLVTDTGVKYRVPKARDLASLGYAESQAVAVPSLILRMLPTGPDLSADAAARAASAPRIDKCGS